MHLTSVEHGVMGSYAIIGAHLPIACGAAWSAQYRGTDQVAVCFFGDGTTNIGAFHEALNFAAIWKLPVVFVCENNLWMEYTRTSDVTAVAHPAADRAAPTGSSAIIVDGNDADAVFEVAVAAIARARAGEGPSMIEAETYRHGGHSRADPGKYRPDEEVAEWLAKDPIPRYRPRLVGGGREREPSSAPSRTDVAAEVERATEEAKAGAVPGEDLLMKERMGGRGILMAQLTFREAIARGIAQEMRRDESVVFLGEDVGAAGGVFKGTVGLLEEFGAGACATRRSASRPSWAPRWARR